MIANRSSSTPEFRIFPCRRLFTNRMGIPVFEKKFRTESRTPSGTTARYPRATCFITQ